MGQEAPQGGDSEWSTSVPCTHASSQWCVSAADTLGACGARVPSLGTSGGQLLTPARWCHFLSGWSVIPVTVLGTLGVVASPSPDAAGPAGPECPVSHKPSGGADAPLPGSRAWVRGREGPVSVLDRQPTHKPASHACRTASERAQSLAFLVENCSDFRRWDDCSH